LFQGTTAVPDLWIEDVIANRWYVTATYPDFPAPVFLGGRIELVPEPATFTLVVLPEASQGCVLPGVHAGGLPLPIQTVKRQSDPGGERVKASLPSRLVALIISVGIPGLPGAAEAASQPAYPAINKLIVPTNATVLLKAVSPDPPSGKPPPLPAPDYDTNSWFQALAENASVSLTNPDTHGAVDPNHVMAMLDTEV